MFTTWRQGEDVYIPNQLKATMLRPCHFQECCGMTCELLSRTTSFDGLHVPPTIMEEYSTNSLYVSCGGHARRSHVTPVSSLTPVSSFISFATSGSPYWFRAAVVDGDLPSASARGAENRARFRGAAPTRVRGWERNRTSGRCCGFKWGD